MKKHIHLKKLAITSCLVAVAIALELITKLFSARMPFGGNFIGISAVPLLIVGFTAGLPYGIVAGFIYGNVEVMLSGGGYAVGPSILLDYIFGYTFFGITGIFHKKIEKYQYVIIGCLFGYFLRYLSVSFAGVFFWSDIINADAFHYSFIIYNLGYNVSSFLICCTIILVARNAISILAKRTFNDYL